MNRATIVLIALIFAFCIYHVSAAGIGLAPSRFTMEDTLKGGSCDQIFTLFNTVDEPFDYEFEGTGDIGEWVCFYALDGKTPIESIKVHGKSTEKVIARFTIPSDTPNGVYTGTVDVLTALKDVTVDTPEKKGIVAQPVLRLSSRGRIGVTGGVLVEKETPTVETSTETPTVTETSAVTETPTPASETDLAMETPTVTEAPAVTETPTPTSEADLTTETPAGTDAETNTKVPGFGFIGALIATIVVFVIAKKSGKKGEK